MNKQTKEQLQSIVDDAPDMYDIEHDELLYCSSFSGSYKYTYILDERIYTFEHGKWHKQKE